MKKVAHVGLYLGLSILATGIFRESVLNPTRVSHRNVVLAQEGSADNGAVARASVTEAMSGPGSVSPYMTAFIGGISLSDSVSAIASWSQYVQSRSQWSLSSASINRLASADFAARQNGAATITASQIATAISSAINIKLSTITDSDAQALLQQMTTENVPNGKFGPNSYNSSYFTIAHPGSSYSITVSASAISAQKSLYLSLLPQAISSSSSFYPTEAQLIMYSLASGDIGYGDSTLAVLKAQIGNATGLDMTGRPLFGSNGYLARRPLVTFLDQSFIDTFYSQIGF